MIASRHYLTPSSTLFILLSSIILLCSTIVTAFTPHLSSSSSSSSSVSSTASSKSPACNVDQASTVWMCISTILVLGMSPALALFEGGMLRSKNSISIISQVISGVIVLSVMWFCFGYSLTFGPSHSGVIGDLSHAFYIGISYTDCSPHAPSIPAALFATFQMMFAVITPLLMTGALAERMKFKSFMLFIVLWQIVVYYPLAHWIWGGGFLNNIVYDFAGGIVIHASAGTGSLICALYLGRRKHFFDFMGEFPPSNLPLATTGTALLWIGWFGFNGGSALASGAVAVSAIVSTQIGCSCSAFVWLLLSWYHGKPQAAALMNGALAGLAGITPASGYINTPATILVGCLCGLASYYSVVMMKHHLHIDDALDVSSVHGLTGIIGALAIGFFADSSIDPAGPDSILTGHPMQLANQAGGIAVAVVWSAAMTFAILNVLDMVQGGAHVRATEEEEELGMDWSDHREVAYHRLQVLNDDDNDEDRVMSTFEPSAAILSALQSSSSLNLDRPTLLVPSPIPSPHLSPQRRLSGASSPSAINMHSPSSRVAHGSSVAPVTRAKSHLTIDRMPSSSGYRRATSMLHRSEDATKVEDKEESVKKSNTMSEPLLMNETAEPITIKLNQ